MAQANKPKYKLFPNAMYFDSFKPELQALSDKSDMYIRESIASETEFPITNGRSKIIRLPKGDYRYAIRQNSGPFSEEFYLPKKKITASGSINGPKEDLTLL